VKAIYPVIGAFLLSSAVYAQQPPATADAPPPPPAERPDGPSDRGPGDRAPDDRGPGRPDRPPRPQGGPGLGGPGMGGPGGGMGPGMGGPGMGGPGMGAPGGRGGYGGGFGGGADGWNDPRMIKFELMRGYLDVVDRYARLAHDPSTSGIAAVVAAGDILRPRGADAVIDYFTKALPDVKSPAVQRAIRLQLIDLYKQAGKVDQALEQMKILMTADAGKDDSAKQ
jgi:hypothetical protein